jgi:GT2 family glycosyltransferase
MQTGAQRYGIVNPVIRGLDSEGKINGTRCNLSCFGRDELQTKYMRSKHAVKLDSKSWKTWRIAVGACAIRRDIYHDIGGIDAGILSFGVDSSLTLRAWCAGYDIALLMDTEIGHLFRKNFRPGTSPHWAQLYANQLRIVATVGDEDDMRERHERLSGKMKDAYRKAVELFEANSVPLPVIEQKRTLKEYWAETGQEVVA